MKAPPYFIIIPAAGGDTYYIKPYEIINLVVSRGTGTQVTHREGDATKRFNTLLTAQEIHERILELEEANFKFTFGEE